MRFRLLVIVALSMLLSLALVQAAQAATPIYVRPGGDDTNCDGTADVDYPGGAGPLPCAVQTLQKGIDLVDSGGTVHVGTGTYVLASQVNVNKASITLDGDGAGSTIVQVSGTGHRFYISASGVTLQDFEIQKTDKTGVQNIIYVGANDVTIRDNLIYGQFVIGDNEVSRALEVAYGTSNLTIQGNTIHSLRQPGYLNGSLASPTTGSIANNHVYLTKGWVLASANMTYTGNTWGTGANANVYDIAILSGTDASYYPDIVAISDANNNAVVEDQRVSPAVLSDVFVDASAPGPAYNGGATEPYLTIGPAITRVVARGTIYVAVGTYNERVTINKALELRGAQYGVDPTPAGARTVPANESIITEAGLSTPNPDVLIEIPSGVANVTIDGFTLNGDQTNATADTCVLRIWDDNVAVKNNIIDGYTGVLYKGNDHLTVYKNRITANKTAVVVQPNAATYVVVSGNKIVPGTSPASDAQGVYMTGCSDCDVTGNSVTGFSGSNAVGGSNMTRLEISGNTFAGCKKGINFWGTTTFVDILNNTISGCSSHGINIKGQDINIQNNSITGNGIGVEIDKHTLTTERVTIDHNTISGNTGLALSVTATVLETVDAENNYWGTVVFSDIAPKISGLADWSPWCNSDFSVCTYTWPVHNITQGIDYQTIQAAVDDADPGDVIQADAGTYLEQVTIDRSLDVSGAGAATTFIQAPSPMLGDTSGYKNIVTITGSGVSAELSGFTVEGPSSADLNVGIYVRDGATANIHDNILQNLGTGSNTLGILVGRSAHSTTGTATITANTISGYDKGGIVVDNVGSSATISGNTITGSGANPVTAENGIQISRGATATVSGNTVSGHVCTSVSGGCTDDPTTSLTADGASGILLYASGTGVTISGNTLTANQYAIWTVAAADAEVRENSITGASGTGIAIWDSDQWTDVLGFSPVGTVATIANNTLSTHEYGVLVRDYTADSAYPSVTVIENSISGNSALGAWADVDVDASGNWWGSADPATVKAAANGGSLIDYTPWLASGTDTGDPGFQGDFSTLWVDDDSPQTGTTGRIQEAIDLVTGSTVNIAAGTYPEPVNIENRTNLTLSGEDKTTVVMQPTSTLCGNVSTWGCGRTAVFRVVNSTNTVLQNMTFDFGIVKGNDVIGLLVWDSTGTVNNNILKNMSGSDAGGYYYEITSYVRAPSYTDGARAQVAFTGNSFIDTGRIGIVTHDFVHSTISGNTFHKDFDDFGYAMEIGSRSTATISGNIIDGYDTPAASDSSESAGIYIENAFTGGMSGVTKNVSVNGNEIYGCQWALYIGNEFDGYAGDIDVAVTATGNNLHNNADGAVVITDEDKEAGSSVSFTGSGNTLTDNGDYGYFIYTWGDGDVTVSLDGETISGHDVGIYLNDYAETPPSGSSYSVEVHDSGITGNTTYGVQNEYSGTTIDATLNWWGSACGPSGGNPVSDYVDYSPWWADAAMTTTASEGAGGELVIPAGATTAQAQAILDCAGPDAMVMFESGSYSGGLLLHHNGQTIKLNNCTVSYGSPAFTVTADDVTVLGPGKVDGGGGGGAGILVQAGADNFILDGVQVTGWANGVELAGDVTSFKLVSNWIHTNAGSGLLVDSDVDLGGIVTIEGNLFKNNTVHGIQHNGNGTLPAEYNSWGDPDGPDAGTGGDGIGGDVDAEPWTYVESFFDVTLEVERHVPEDTSFDVLLQADAVNLYGISFKFTYDPAKLTLNSTTFAAPWAGKCYDQSSTGTVSYACYLADPQPEWSATAGTIAAFNFTTYTLPDETPVTAYLDLSHLEGDTSAGAKGGQKVFVNNAGFNDPSATERDITDTDDGRIIIEPTANYSGFVDLQGRANDSGAQIEVYNQETKSGAIKVAQGTSASSGAYATSHVASPWLIPSYTYWMVVDRALYLPTTPVAATTYAGSKTLSVVPYTTLAKVVLLGGDASNDNEILVTDLTCIGGDYGGTGVVCGTDGWTDVNGDGIVNVQDLSLAGGNLYKTSSPWTP